MVVGKFICHLFLLRKVVLLWWNVKIFLRLFVIFLLVKFGLLAGNLIWNLNLEIVLKDLMNLPTKKIQMCVFIILKKLVGWTKNFMIVNETLLGELGATMVVALGVLLGIFLQKNWLRNLELLLV